MPSHFRYLIIGGGMTADAAVTGIREKDTEGSIGLFSMEKDPPYNRPPLTKGLWTGKKIVENIWRNTSQNVVEMHLNCEITQINLEAHSVRDQNGNTYTYEKLLLATGGSPRRLQVSDPGILYYRTLNDYRLLRQASGPGKHLAVIGGGFIGSEIAAGLTMAGSKVSIIFPENNIGSRVYPADLAQYLDEYYQSKGVEVRSGEMIETIEPHGTGHLIRTKSGNQISVDGVVAGIGLQVNTQLAQAAGLKVDNGIQVDEFLRTSDPDVFSSGDAANFYNPALGKRLRLEHEDNALMMGRVAGRNMAGDVRSAPQEPFDYLAYFYSDLFDLGYEAVGELDSRHQIVADWSEKFKKGVIYYLNEERVRGVLLWNVWDQVPAARALIANPGAFNDHNVKGRIPV